MKPQPKRVLVATAIVGSITAAFLAGRALAGGIPATGALTYSGLLQNASGAALTGSHPIQINFWDAATGGTTPLCQTASTSITLDAGRFSVALPDNCTNAVKNTKDVWAEVLVDGVSLGRAKLGAVPYAVEAGHSTSADSATNATTAATANAAAGSLQTTLTQMQSDITALKNNYAVSNGYYVGPTAITDHLTYTFVSGTPAVNLAAGETVFAWNTSQVWAINSNHGTPGCASCTSGTIVLKACYRVGAGAPVMGSAFTQSDAAGIGPGSESSAHDYFPFAAATNNVSFGLCARLYDASPNRWDMNVGNVYTIIQRHK